MLECSECGTRLDEWDPKKGGHFQAYEARTFTCPGCNMSEGTYDYELKDGRKPGLKVRLAPTRFHPIHSHLARTQKR